MNYETKLKKNLIDYENSFIEEVPAMEQNIPGLEYTESQFNSYEILKNNLNQMLSGSMATDGVDEFGNPVTSEQDPVMGIGATMSDEEKQLIYDELTSEEVRKAYVPLMGDKLYKSLIDSIMPKGESINNGKVDDYASKISSLNMIDTMDALGRTVKTFNKDGAALQIYNAAVQGELNDAEANYLINLFGVQNEFVNLVEQGGEEETNTGG
jgi:hypothetical protein